MNYIIVLLVVFDENFLGGIRASRAADLSRVLIFEKPQVV
jgi:hypothetical protein